MSDVSFHQQVEELSSLVDYHSSRNANVYASCRKLLRLLQNEEVYDFVFGIGEFSPLSALQDPNLCHNAGACTIQQISFEAPCYSSCRTRVASSSFLLATVFCGVGYSLGLLVGDQKFRAFKDLHCTEEDKSTRALMEPDVTRVMRFVKDDQDGTIFIFVDEGRFMNVEINRAESTVCCRLIGFTFDRQRLMKTLRNVPTEDDLVRCLYLHDEVDMLRKCPLCSASPLDPCQCSLRNLIDGCTISRPRDDSISSTILPLFLGDFQGVMGFQHFASGALLESKAMGTVRRIRPITDWSTKTSLVNCGITFCINELTFDPWVAVLPAPEENQTDDVLLIDCTAEPTCSDDKKETEIELKKKIRIERNRAFARRSNLRKKMENDSRKNELKRLRTLEAELVAKERKLRQENLIMRSLLQH